MTFFLWNIFIVFDLSCCWQQEQRLVNALKSSTTMWRIMKQSSQDWKSTRVKYWRRWYEARKLLSEIVLYKRGLDKYQLYFYLFFQFLSLAHVLLCPLTRSCVCQVKFAKIKIVHLHRILPSLCFDILNIYFTEW